MAIKVLCVFGTRPEAIKMAPVVTELRRRDDFACRVAITAQHRGMLDDVLDLFDIVPEVDLDVMQEGQSPTRVASAVLSGLESVLQAERPDWLIVQGDTTTTMAASVAAFLEHVRIAHVEAGLRTGDRHRPFPEELNRRITDLVADLYFVPTQRARENLLAEGVAGDDIVLTGNTVIDALLDVTGREPAPQLPDSWAPAGKRLILLTAHRRESFGAPLLGICRAAAEIATSVEDVHVLYPVHPNPHVKAVAEAELSSVPNLELAPPLDYLTLATVMRRSYLILTDSGGIQEEAPTFGVPVLVLRALTERPEAVEAGTARVVGTDPARIVAEARRLLEDPAAHAEMARSHNPFGDGLAAKRIAEALLARS